MRNCEQKHTSANDALLQTGALDARTARFEKDSSPEMEAQMLSRTQSLAPGKLGEPFFNAMHKMTDDYFASQGSSAGDCGVPGGATDRRRAGCIIPISGPTEDMACCTSCCQGLMGECGPCEGLREGIEHTDKRKAVPMQTAVEAESVGRCRHTQHYPCWYGHAIERLWAVAQEVCVCGECEEKSSSLP